MLEDEKLPAGSARGLPGLFFNISMLADTPPTERISTGGLSPM
jgi:hypothetical protein